MLTKLGYSRAELGKGGEGVKGVELLRSRERATSSLISRKGFEEFKGFKEFERLRSLVRATFFEFAFTGTAVNPHPTTTSALPVRRERGTEVNGGTSCKCKC